jgi:hypothetical protein
MFMVAWEGKPPADRAEWIEVLRGVFTGTSGNYHIRFHPGRAGWRFDLECRVEFDGETLGVVANSPETIRFTLVQALTEAGKPVDPDWRG